MVEEFLDLCDKLKVPVSLEKTVWASELMVFLGILLDGRNFILALPIGKKDRAIKLLLEIKDKKKSTVRDLQKLCRYLNFISKAIYPGRAFTRRMYAKFSEVLNTGGVPANSFQYKFKQHYHVRTDAEFKKDCDIWLLFLTDPKWSRVVNRPMVDLTLKPIDAKDISFYSDASAAESLGFGAILKDFWIRGNWGTDFMNLHNPSIEYLELFALAAGLLTWNEVPEMCNTRVRLHCDNIAVVHMINQLTSSCKNCMVLIRLIILDCLKYNRRISAVYIPSKDNCLADALSRNQMDRFRKLGTHMRHQSDRICENIWPISKIWLD